MEQLNDYDFEMPQTPYNYRVSSVYICVTNEFTCQYIPCWVSGIFSVHNLNQKAIVHVYCMLLVHLVFGPIYAECNAIVCNTMSIYKVCQVFAHTQTLHRYTNWIYDEDLSDLITSTHCKYSTPSSEHMHDRLYCSIKNPLSVSCTDGQTFHNHYIQMSVNKTELLLYCDANVCDCGKYLQDLKYNRLLAKRFADIGNNLPIFVTTDYFTAAIILTYDPDVLLNGSSYFH